MFGGGGWPQHLCPAGARSKTTDTTPSSATAVADDTEDTKASTDTESSRASQQPRGEIGSSVAMDGRIEAAVVAWGSPSPELPAGGVKSPAECYERAVRPAGCAPTASQQRQQQQIQEQHSSVGAPGRRTGRQRRNATGLEGGGLAPTRSSNRRKRRGSLSELSANLQTLLTIQPQQSSFHVPAYNSVFSSTSERAATSGLQSIVSQMGPTSTVLASVKSAFVHRSSSLLRPLRHGRGRSKSVSSRSINKLTSWELLNERAQRDPEAILEPDTAKYNRGISEYHKTARMLQWTVALQLVLNLARDASLLMSWALVCAEESAKCPYLQSPYLTRWPTFISPVLAYTMLIFLHACHCHRIWRLRRAVRSGRDKGMCAGKLRSKELRLVAGHWTPVASSDIYMESADLVVQTGHSCVIVFFAAALFGAESQLRSTLTGSDPLVAEDTATEICRAFSSPGQSPVRQWACTTGEQGMQLLQTLSTALLGTLLGSVLFIPEKFWSPLVKIAMQKTGNFQLGRVLGLNGPVACMYAMVAAVAVPYVAVYLSPDLRHHLDMSVYLEVSVYTLLCVILISAALILRCLNLRGIARHFWRALKQPWQVVRSPDGPRAFWTNPFGLLVCRYSRRYRQLILLGGCTFSFALSGEEQRVEYELWALRLLLLVLSILSRDEPTSLERLLEDGGAGFGLLVDAPQLCRALEAHLGGHVHVGDIRTYKATMLRMEDTLTISYRWQQSSANITYGPSQNCMKLNMSTWQMQAVVDAIKNTKCLYLWLDVCSVPQEDTPTSRRIKKVLLARMMASYASAFVTLVLLSKERDTHRYHQRTWTLQEYCASQRLMVVKEDSGAEGAGDEEQQGEILSVKDGEVRVVGQLRYEHLLRQPLAMPVWLSNNVESLMAATRTEDALQIWQTYKNLSERLSCLHDMDSVRALYPLLWNCPAESEDELISLVQALEHVHSIPQQRELSLLQGDQEPSKARTCMGVSLQGWVPSSTLLPTETIPGAVHSKENGGQVSVI